MDKTEVYESAKDLMKYLSAYDPELRQYEMLAINAPERLCSAYGIEANDLITSIGERVNAFDKLLFPDGDGHEIQKRFDEYRQPGHENDSYPPDFGDPMTSTICQWAYSACQKCIRISDAMSLKKVMDKIN